jgi:hypothetical protein
MIVVCTVSFSRWQKLIVNRMRKTVSVARAARGLEIGATGDLLVAMIRPAYSRTRIAAPNGTPSEWLLPQEKATLKVLHLGT